jgi:hypothetical protein
VGALGGKEQSADVFPESQERYISLSYTAQLNIRVVICRPCSDL